MNTKTKEHVISGLITFIVAFSVSVASTIGDPTVDLEQTAMISAIIVALRAGVKEVITFLTTLIKPE